MSIFSLKPAPRRARSEALLEDGFTPSAKHRFQLLKAMPVRGEPLIFNVDLLHPTEALSDRPDSAEMFVEHIELNVPLGAKDDLRFRTKSIAAPHSGFLFKDERFVTHFVEVEDLEGVRRGADVPVIDELGLIVTKSNSVRDAKRQRDAFDIYLAIAHARDADQLLRSTQELAERTPEAFLSLAHIRSVLQDGSFDRRANAHMPEGHRCSPEILRVNRPFSSVVREFLDEAGVPTLEPI